MSTPADAEPLYTPRIEISTVVQFRGRQFTITAEGYIGLHPIELRHEGQQLGQRLAYQLVQLLNQVLLCWRRSRPTANSPAPPAAALR